jgi:hypothetical protein
MRALKDPSFEADIRATWDWLKKSSGLTERLKDLRAPVMIFRRGLDRHIGPDRVQAVNGALREAKKPYVNGIFGNNIVDIPSG